MYVALMEEPPVNHASSIGEKHTNEPTPSKAAAQCSVISVYQAKFMGISRNVTVMWCKSLINHSLTVSVEKAHGDAPFACKIDLKPWPFWSKKGFKTFEVDSRHVDIFWDLRSAKFSNGPEPAGGYYIALVCNEEVVLLVGDCKKEAYRRTKCRPSIDDATLVSKRENVFGKKCFSTRTKFDDRRKEHDIVIENSISGPKDPEMWISIDGMVLIHVNNLQWKFRGNKTVLVEQIPVQVFWDVHNWLFSSPGLGHASFTFKPGAPDNGGDEDRQGNESGQSFPSQNEADQCLPGDVCGSSVPEFCFSLSAWKME